MPTVVTSPIGANRTGPGEYTTIQAWMNDCPVNLVSADKVWKGECYNDQEFAAGVIISGIVTDATRFIWLTCAPGESFVDHPNVRTNPLTYDITKGVGISAGGATDAIINIANAYTLVERLQIKRTSGGTYSSNSCVTMSYTNSGQLLKDCLLYKSGSNANGKYLARVQGQRAYNCVAIATSGGGAFELVDGGTLFNCTAVSTGAATGVGFSSSYYYGSVNNCVAVGWSSDFSVLSSYQFYNASGDATALGTGAITSIVAANVFESATADFRLKAGSPLIDAGNTNATYAPNDITGTIRAVGLDGDIGAWEWLAPVIPDPAINTGNVGAIWTSKTRTRQPENWVSLAPRYQNALVSGIGSLPRTPLKTSGNVTSLVPNGGLSTGPGGRAWNVFGGGGGGAVTFRNGAGSDTYFQHPGGSWTVLIHCSISALSGANPGFIRGNDYLAAGHTMFVIQGANSLPWVRASGVEILKPSSGQAVSVGMDTVFVCSMSSGSRVDVAWDGAVRHSATHSKVQSGDRFYRVGDQGSGFESVAGNYYSFTWLPWATTPQETAELSTPAGYYGNVFAPQRTPVFYSIAGITPGAGGSANRILQLRKPGLSRSWK